PKALYPKIDQDIVFPTSWKEWDELIYQLVKHCNRDQKYGIQYWEVGNEVNIGEEGGTPYRFKPDDYLIYYTHTANAIRRADPQAKVGGPALAGYKSPIVDALLQYCGSGKAPLDFLSWHIYDSDVKEFRRSIEYMKAKLAKYPRLKHVETILDEWNMSLSNPDLNPYFQPAFIMENTYDFYKEGLTRSGYYHIRDFFVDPKGVLLFTSQAGSALTEHWWNVMPQYDGLYDNQGRVRPAYYAFKLLSLIRGERLALTGTNSEVKGFAARDGQFTEVVFWNYPSGEEEKTLRVTVRFPFVKEGEFQVAKLNPVSAVNNMEVVRHQDLSNLTKNPIQINLRPYEIYWVELEPPGW
ncbi:MAG: GH39 family glycosyl hydrolase, partial [Terriglobia bacterium]